ncbi:MAG: hypothetical protein OXN84_02565, partial [Albidovulum sp.]|nr:hypothetical protein [Albidovulum sp.]
MNGPGILALANKEDLERAEFVEEKAACLPPGRPKGPGKSKLDPYRPEIEAILQNGSTQKFIAKRYG